MTAKVIVTLKNEVLDPQGKAIEGSLMRLGYTEVESVRAGKYIEVVMSEDNREKAEERLQDMCSRLLCNPVIEDVRYEFAD